MSPSRFQAINLTPNELELEQDIYNTLLSFFLTLNLYDSFFNT